MGKRRYAFVFICQSGPLEMQAMLLAASLKRFLRCDYELIAGIPTPASRWGQIAPKTLRFLGNLGVRTVEIRNQIDETYGIANKVACLSVPTSADKLVFLDSDMLCVSEFEDQERFGIAFNAKPASVMLEGGGGEDVWKKIYSSVGMDVPTLRVKTTVSGEFLPPYFNSGFVAVDAKAGLGEIWAECCRKIDANPAVKFKRPWLDQMALPVAVAKLGLDIDCLDDYYNWPGHLRPLGTDASPAGRQPIFYHYHWPKVIRREPLANQLVHELLEEAPIIKEAMAAFSDWEGVGRVPKPSRAWFGARRATTNQPSDLVITGIPRSGTSYLCNLLHRFDNCVVLNEPGELVGALAHEEIPWSIPVLYREVRRDVGDGKAVTNKLKDGKVVEDTLVHNERCAYVPKVNNTAFVLGMKNTISFLSRLDAMRQAMPWARIAACVRDPFATIASWKSSFDHLATADVRGIVVGGLEDRWLSGSQRRELENLEPLPTVALRRAAFWAYLGRLILKHQRDLILVRYEDIVLQPREILGKILAGMDAGRLKEPVNASTVRRKTHLLDAEDVQAIRMLCSGVAAELGVDGSGLWCTIEDPANDNQETAALKTRS